MAALKFSILAFLFYVTSAIADEKKPVSFNNQLSACTSISDIKTLMNEKIPVLSINIDIDESIADCGCKSALGAYSVYINNSEYRSFIMGGKISLLTSGLKYLPLTTGINLINKKNIEVVLSCSQPD